eukprot:COSAG04_NODE_1449_length_6694_cov_8.506748_2_plen_259_part_00
MAGGGGDRRQTALQWARGATGWAVLPTPTTARQDAAAVSTLDGKAMVIGGWGGQSEGDTGEPLASVETFAADGSGWLTIAPMSIARDGPAAAVLPCGKVMVAGGYDGGQPFKTAELWDPATGAWSDLPPMAGAQYGAGCCVLPSGRVAVVGGLGADEEARGDGEAFDPVARTWHPLPPMAYARNEHGVVAVAGGMVAVGGGYNDDSPAELFDEASGRWFVLPHPMVEPRTRCAASVLSLPAAALSAARAAGAAPTPNQ